MPWRRCSRTARSVRSGSATSWSSTSPRFSTAPWWCRRSTLDDPLVADVATAHGRTPAQVMLRWGVQHGRSVIPKSTRPSRIKENINVFDFALSEDEMAEIDSLDTGRRGGPEPDAITLEAFGRNIPEA